jgi:Ca2+-binding RTX toxin-like protein
MADTIGTSGNDILTGTAGNDVITGLAGNARRRR